MVLLKSTRVHCCSLSVLLVLVCVSWTSSAPQFLDTFAIEKSANSTYKYESINGLQRGYSYAYGNTYSSGYKSKTVDHYTGTPVIIHAPDNRSFVKFGIRRPDDELVFLESKHSQLNDQKQQEIVFETTAPDHKFSHVELFTNDPNFLLTTEFSDNALLARFTYASGDQNTQKHATINVFGYNNERPHPDCFLYYLNCETKQ